MRTESSFVTSPESSKLGLEVVELTSETQFMELEHAWNELAREARPRSVFVQHEWFAAAWAWQKAHFRLQMLVVRRGSQLLGALPLVRRSDKVSRIVEYELLAVPDTQLADVLCVPANADEVVHALASTLARDTRWDKLRLDFLPPEGVAVKSLAVALQRQDLGVVVQDCGRNFFVELSGTWERYYAGRSRRMKKAMKLAANRLHRTGDIHIEWLGPGAGDPERLAEALNRTIDISAKSWKRETGNSLDQPGPQAFIRSLSQRAFQRDWLSIWLLHVGGIPVAMEYALMFDGSIHALRADFDERCVKTSPGAYLFSHLLEQLFAHDHDRYYMGRGDNAYKLRWSNESEPLRQVVAYNRTPGGRLEWLREEWVKPALRKTRDALWITDKEYGPAHRGNSR